MKTKHAAAIRYGILVARALVFPERLTDWQIHQIEVSDLRHRKSASRTIKAHGREYRRQFAALEAKVRHPNCRCSTGEDY